MRHAIYLPPFGPLADPSILVDLAVAAEQAGWDGFFVWDHVLSPVPGQWAILDPWVALGAVATATHTIRLGPLVTPLPRRRVIKLARESVTLDLLSGGRLTLGLGLGVDDGREFSAFDEETDPRRRGDLLDEGVATLTELWSGHRVSHRGEITVDDVRATPVPVQQPRIPLWFATTRAAGRPVHRAAGYDGIFPFDLGPEAIGRIAETVRGIRGGLDGFDIAVAPGPDADIAAYRRAGMTWLLRGFWPGDTPELVLDVIDSRAG